MELKLRSKKREEIIDITKEIESYVKKSKVKQGFCLIYVPHATAAVTINESYDKAICSDFLEALRKIAPKGIWKHDKIDNNGDSHIKAAIVGPSEIIPIKDFELTLGRWQGIMFYEFDGPRERKVIVEIK